MTLDNTPILKNLEFEIPQNKISIIVGPSGAGKSTFLKSLVRFLPYTGEVLFKETEISNIEVKRLRSKVVYVSQVPVVFPGTVAENILWGRELWQMDESFQVEELLEQVGLPREIKDQNAENLSGGQKQRLHLARSLAIEPEVLLLDEPASSLDAISKEDFEKLIQKLIKSQKQLTIIMVTHDLDQAKRIAEYAILIVDGENRLAAVSEQFFNQVKDMTQADTLRELIKEGNS